MLEKFIINRKLLKELDFSIILIAIIIVGFGIANIYSATYVKYGYHYVTSQLIFLFLSLVVAYFIIAIDYATIIGYSPAIYWFSIALLVLNDTIFKKTVNGASSWMQIGPIQFEPSEIVKIAMILFLAKKFNDHDGKVRDFKDFLSIAIYAIIPVSLIIIQPDMGMSLIFFFITLGIFFVMGLDLKVIGGGVAGIIALFVIIWNSPLMQVYWKTRLISFIDPSKDELGSGMQVIQSQIAIGSGGLLGKGFLKGTQISGGFIPESSTDFIFAVVGEEWGLIGAAVLLTLYGILIYRMIKIAKSSKDVFGTVVTVGVISVMLFSILQNIGMTIGLMPITGITLPFMSSGGTSILANFIGVALVLNIGMRKKRINF